MSHALTCLSTAAFDLSEDQEESLYLCQNAVTAIEAWKSHQMRTVRQDQARIDIFQLLNEENILVVSDWAISNQSVTLLMYQLDLAYIYVN